MRIRHYTPADHAAVVTLFVEGMRSYAGHQGEGHHRYIEGSLERDFADIQGTYMAPGGNFWVATLASADGEDEVIGMIAFERKDGGDGELRRLSVRADCKRFGIGRLLVAHLERWAKASGFTRIDLSTGVVMREANAFYAKVGYRFVREEPESPEYMLACFTKDL